MVSAIEVAACTRALLAVLVLLIVWLKGFLALYCLVYTLI